jgi:hypothetical protein
MPIRPEGDWEELYEQSSRRIQDANQDAQDIYPAQTKSISKSSYPTCKICDRGALSSKTVFRMSGPAVAIGFIFLIPSVLGMVFSALLLLGVNVYKGDGLSTLADRPDRDFQSAFDANFRRSCSRNFKQSYIQASGIPASQPLIEQYCECALSTFKETGSETTAAHTCIQRTIAGTLNPLSDDVAPLYSDDAHIESQASTITRFGRIFGSISAITLGIT